MGTVVELQKYIQSGGFVMWPLIIASFALWFALGWRWATNRRGSSKSVHQLYRLALNGESKESGGIITDGASLVARLVNLVKSGNYPLKHTTDLLDDALADLRAEMDAYATLAKMIVVLAPLAGLLGTVTGMMETFDSLATMALFTQSGGVAGGISQALISTQMGLAVAIPGVIAGRLIDRKQSNLTTELEELKQHALGQLGLLESDAAEKDGSL